MSDAGPPPPGGNPMFRPHDGANPYARPIVPVPPMGPAPRGRKSRGQVPAAVILAGVLVVAGLAAFFLLRPDDAKDPGDTVKAFIKAAAARDSGAVCGSLAQSNLDRFEETGTTCAESFDELFEDVEPDQDSVESLLEMQEDAPTVRIVKVDVKGNRAEVQARIDGELTDPAIILIKEQGAWKLDLDAGEACDREARTLDTAAEAFRAQYNDEPADAEELVDKGFLLEVPEHAELRDGEAVLTGECA